MVLILCIAIILISILKADIEVTNPIYIPKKSKLPKNSFELSKDAYTYIGSPFIALKHSPATLQIPDLKPHLTYYGTNGRPDASQENALLYFTISGSKQPVSISSGQKLYLFYDKKQNPPKYVFSPNNTETSIWLEAQQKEKEALLSISMKNEYDEVISTPEKYAQFTLPEKELIRNSTGVQWELDKFRVDGTLLARQHARWYGTDRFLELVGGDEYKEFVGKERIDFGDNNDCYLCYVQQGDCLVWCDQKWQKLPLGEQTRGLPLMQVRKIEERVMTFDLWDEEGKNKIALTLLKAVEPWMPQTVQQSFKFVGARTRSQCIFEVNNERVLLRHQDWLLMTDNGWQKLSTVEEIDDYVNRKLKGVLFIFDGITKKDDKQLLVGTIFNASRTEMETIELAAQQGTPSKFKENEDSDAFDPEAEYAYDNDHEFRPDDQMISHVNDLLNPGSKKYN